ncbi:helix-turn-helix domain-containing protein [Rubrimonas cliftonensis]|uniref:AraC family transcriptional regulator n=1 Tax=Rubrimonas cliftonensis TaxID=89524 RepID=A0A1H4GAB7_9RHOB|nr:AraC family transcriptional regulator [Rubrimonas cliftonensis]SEB06603.1 AraC family transcriptional regulator [Rubrimonas cliftonensis]
MTPLVHSTSSKWYCEGRQASYVQVRKSPGGLLDLVELARPAGDMSRPAQPDLVLHEDLLGGSRIHGDSGGGSFDVKSTKGDLGLDAPDFAHTMMMDTSHRVRALSFCLAQWKNVYEEATDGRGSLERIRLYRGPFRSIAIQSVLRNLWALSEEEGAPSRLLARAAGCEILAELFRLSGASFTPARGGLTPWAERRCLDLMHARFSEDVSLDELAAEARLSPFHFARMFKQSVGMPPRMYLTRLRMEKARELLELTDLPITRIALEVGYSSNQVLARVFLKHQRISPSDYRRAVRDPARSIATR